MDLLDELPLVLADRTVLRRVLCSLVENAIKYTPEGGRITVAASAQTDEVTIEVTDTGRGILAEDLPHIFDKFYRVKGTQQRGSGLGLTIARKIVEEHEGTIGISSEVGRGTSVTIEIPCHTRN